MSEPTTYVWVVTSPNPRKPVGGYDAGQRGWRLHAVQMAEGEDPVATKRRPAFCGSWPRHGWGVDLFIDTECKRCLSAFDKREAAGEAFQDLEEVWRARREAREAEENKAARAQWEAENLKP